MGPIAANIRRGDRRQKDRCRKLAAKGCDGTFPACTGKIDGSEKSLKGMATMKIEWVKIEAIKPNRRCVCKVEAIEALTASIRQDGQIEPISIWFTGEEFRIIDGEKRWRACKKLGLAKMKAVILEIT